MTVNTQGDVPQTDVVGDVSGIDVSALSAFALSPGAISGRLAGQARVTCACVDLQAVRSRMQGAGRFEVENGEIPGLHLVRAVVLAFGRSASDAPASPGERFSRIGATFALGGGSIATRDLALASPDFDLRGDGTLSTIDGAIDFETDVVLSPELSRQAGTDLVRYAHEGTASSCRPRFPAPSRHRASSSTFRKRLAARSRTNANAVDVRCSTDCCERSPGGF